MIMGGYRGGAQQCAYKSGPCLIHNDMYIMYIRDLSTAVDYMISRTSIPRLGFSSAEVFETKTSAVRPS